VKIKNWVTGESIPASKEEWIRRESIFMKVEDLGDYNPGKELRWC